MSYDKGLENIIIDHMKVAYNAGYRDCTLELPKDFADWFNKTNPIKIK